MARRRRVSRRPASEWAWRAGLAIAALAAGWVSASQTLGYSLRIADPERAHVLAPGDGRVTAQLAEQLIGPGATPADRARADQLARTALRQDPTAVSALSALGINAEVRADTVGARRLFAYAERLSRRNLQTHLWAIEDAVKRDDVADALDHYDLALRTSNRAPELLFPVLVAALTEPEVRAALTRRLAAKPIWSTNFALYAAGNSPDPGATASLFTMLRRGGMPPPEEAEARMVGALTARGEFERGWSYYTQIRAEADRRRARNPDFRHTPAFPTPFDWVALAESGASASMQAGLVDVSAPAGVGGPLLRQLQLLPPGAYRLAGRSSGIDQSSVALPYWVLVCGDGRELGRVTVTNSSVAGGLFAGTFNVPPGCTPQTLTLVARPSDAAGGLSGQINSIELVPAR